VDWAAVRGQGVSLEANFERAVFALVGTVQPVLSFYLFYMFYLLPFAIFLFFLLLFFLSNF
jgi:hypothetical protein